MSIIINGLINRIGNTRKAALPLTVPRRINIASQVLTEQHSPIVKAIEIRRAPTYLSTSERWITFPDDKSIAFPAETFLPKVQMEYNIEPKILPRNVEMERRRREYKNFKIEDALEAEGVKPHDMLPPEKIRPLLSYEEKYDLYVRTNYLPLELFDDEEYDCRTVDDWINLGVIDGVRYPIPATVFVEKAMRKERIFDRNKELLSDLFGWFHAAVTDYDDEKRVWTVVILDGLKRKFHLPRIYIRFFAEDPRKFVQRIATAVKQRQIAENIIRYQFYLDCMQVEGMPTLDEKQQEVIILSVTRHTSMKYKLKHLSDLIDEIVLEYRRVMCDLMWRSLIKVEPQMFNFITWEEINNIQDPFKVPETGKIYTGMEDFTEMKRFFHWMILYVLPEVREAMQCVVVECLYVSNMNLFVSNYGKSMFLSEFESQQLQETSTVIKYLKELWLERITQLVRLCLRDIGKGWFDLEQKDHTMYNMTKLKRFMDLIIHKMQIALRNLVEKSIALYLEVLESPALCTLNVEQNFMWGDDFVNTQFISPINPIFNIDLMMNDKAAYYTTDLELFQEVIVTLLDNSLSQCHQIKQVHPFLLRFLKFPKDLYLSSVGLLEKQVCEVRDRLRTAYQKSIIPLRAYASEYQQYLGIFKLDVEKYVKDFKNAGYSALEVKDEISFQFRMKSILELALPKEIIIGPFRVNVQPLRQFLVQKRQDCCTQLLIMLTGSLRAKIDIVLINYMQIKARLKATPRNIEHLFEEQEWMKTIPLTVKPLNETVQRLKFEYDILDYFWWNLSDQDFEAKWQAISFPRQVQLHVEETTERFISEYEKLYKVQVQDQIMLSERIDTLVGNITNVSLQTDITKVHEMAIEVKRIWKMMKECQELGLLLNKRQKLFGMDVVPFERLNEMMKEFEPYQSLWSTASDWLKWQEIWIDNPLITVNANEIENLVNDMQKTMSRCIKFFQENSNIVAIAIAIRDQIEAFRPYISMIQALRNPGMKTRDFEELSKQTGIQIALTPTLTFKNLVVLGVMNFEEIIKSVADAAAKEYLIEDTLSKIIAEWKTITMDIIPYKTTSTYIMKVSDDVLILLDDDILNIQQISFSPYKAAFETQIIDWEIKLRLIQEVITLWIEVQKQWMYLEPIFSSKTINRQLPVESRQFNTMECSWRRIMKNAYEYSHIIITCPDKILFESLKECLSLLEIVQKGLSDYLETKRMIFPRFFFLSDDELLEIIVQSKHVQAVQPHLKKCFENIRELRFEVDLRIIGMYSAEYEEVTLRPPICPKGNVEDWLGQVESAMRNTLREFISEALEVVEQTPRKEWVCMWPGQVVLCGGQAYWTAHVEEGIRNDTLSDYYNLMLLHLETLRELIRSPQTESQRLMLEAVITIEVHAKDVLYKLIEERVTSVNDFEWISQLRYYWMNNKDLKVRAVNAEFPYEYEYLGNNGRLVITPLTERCYLTLTSALHLKFGGAPTGPAGTGKTETTKDLAKAFAIQCVVFNCSNQLDFRAMSKFFKGLTSSGAWVCFDEFNRIDIEVLSVVAQQIMTIQKAQQIVASVFLFEGIEFPLKSSCAVFITMNPGYASRTELPDNLKTLFRPVAMMVPDYALIIEISLFSYGFMDAKNLSRKITTTFKLCSEQLSTQDHYDFGMRAIKTVIVVAGNLRREQKDLQEDQICLLALRDVNVPMFLKDDLKLFNSIVSDLFPGFIEKPVDYGILETGIRKSIRQMGLEDVNDFVKKIIQLYDTMLVRNGLMLVGSTGSGKTKVSGRQYIRNKCFLDVLAELVKSQDPLK
ncbi:hypothetical protein DMN91_000909 [Ooceraea biroi]|uniref:Dynein heavy chain 1, axonemal n=1 Tax=Ooceraea biroi TaxID=2015173 RepID=A0A3L8E2Z5_OOCBI|nr:hypothetical protein DMN91_000909 [Ooceraea biroi]